jgi:competence protein ComFC
LAKYNTKFLNKVKIRKKMRCFSCGALSIEPICKICQRDILSPDIDIKKVGNLEVIGFLDYYLAVDFIKSKYNISGYRIYKFFAKKYFNPFLKNYVDYLDNIKIYLIGINEDRSRGYSVISLLLHHGAKGIKNLKPLHNVLKANNKVKYAGKSLQFRLSNSRAFKYRGPKNIDAILIDDTITTGTTMQEAYRVLKENNVNVHFALTVAIAKEEIDY